MVSQMVFIIALQMFMRYTVKWDLNVKFYSFSEGWMALCLCLWECLCACEPVRAVAMLV